MIALGRKKYCWDQQILAKILSEYVRYPVIYVSYSCLVIVLISLMKFIIQISRIETYNFL